ncbi:UvrD-helicase domain-containing protein [Athalassotoga saccharophila]|uniref:DNA 3'-5' helicase n=1 Tax=Athalassotoga saccharophila TaxID=1441386 RepID=A0A6N4TEH6_9BACT|nr:UvrD-helicase domain-containing protein [Athalassotoga saccharophila]BBJ29137.1 ATP-dependent helicase/nuclease subunit A [Athalassotoga saccharophila]
MIKRKWKDTNNVLIIPGFKYEEAAIKYGLFIAKNRRPFKPSKYIAFYSDGIIRVFARIVSVLDDVDLIHDIYPGTNIPFIDYLRIRDAGFVKSLASGERKTIFILDKIKPCSPIVDDSSKKTGFIHTRPKYTTIDKLLRSSFTSQLDDKNNQKSSSSTLPDHPDVKSSSKSLKPLKYPELESPDSESVTKTFSASFSPSELKRLDSKSLDSKSSNLKPTDEQEEIIKRFGDGKNILVRAFAGTGKTTTLKLLTLTYPKRRFLYIVFNRVAAESARKTFGSNVSVRTIHSLAFGFMKDKINVSNFVNNYQIPNIADTLGVDYDYARAVKIIFDEFCYSNVMEIGDLDFSLFFRDNIDLLSLVKTGAISIGKALRYTEQFYRKMEDGKIPVTHNFYLKQFQRLGMADSVRYDAILLDEAQDSNLITYDIVNRIKGQKVVIGDRHQKIYGFRNSLDISGRFLSDRAEEMPLTNSFRFHEEIATLANNLLSTLKAERIRIRGVAPHRSVSNKAFITRTNAKIVEIISWMIRNNDWKTVRDPRELFKLPMSITKLFTNPRINYEIPADLSFLERFKRLDELEEYARDVNDIEMMSAISIAKRKSSVIEKCFLKAMDQFNLENARVYLTTAHTSKGLEWDEIHLSDDYPNLFKAIGRRGGIPRFIYMQNKGESNEIEDIIEEINLLYVAVTRAREKADIADIENSDTLFSGDIKRIVEKTMLEIDDTQKE